MTRHRLPVRRILVAIRDAHHVPPRVLRKVASIARATHARVELFHSINEPVALETIRRGNASGLSYPDLLQATAKRSQARLDRVAHSPAFKGLNVAAVSSWDYPAHEAIVRRALASKADLVVAGVQPHRLGVRLVLSNTDWELIRHCPAPLLLIKTPRGYRKPAIVAAVDPFHAHSKPAGLDERILKGASTLASHLGGALHVFHAYMPLTMIAPVPVGQPLAITLPPEFEEVHAKRVTEVFDRMARKHGIPPARRHLRVGEVSGELEGVVRRTRATIVVMGAISRSGLKRLFIGSTAEKVLDRMSCDLLVVKPRAFSTRVRKRAQTPLPLPVA